MNWLIQRISETNWYREENIVFGDLGFSIDSGWHPQQPVFASSLLIPFCFYFSSQDLVDHVIWLLKKCFYNGYHLLKVNIVPDNVQMILVTLMADLDHQLNGV